MDAVTGAGEQDGPPPSVDEWKAETKAIERVIEVTMTLDRPRTADWVADEAAVASQTARDHLGTLSELGIVAQTTARGVTKYRLDTAYLRFKELSTYVERHDEDQLMDVTAEVQDKIAAVKDRFQVDDPGELRTKATEEGTSADTVREYKQAAAEWESLEHRLDVLNEALERYDEFSRPEAVA